MGWALRPKPKLIQTKPNSDLQISLISLLSLSLSLSLLSIRGIQNLPAIVCSSGTRIGDENHLGFADTGRPLRVVDGSPVTFFFLGFLCCTDGGFEKLDQIWYGFLAWWVRECRSWRKKDQIERRTWDFFWPLDWFFLATCHSSILKEGFKLGGTQKPYSHKPFSAKSISQWQLI